MSTPKRVRLAIVGCGAVSDYHHVPGIRLDPRAELVAACDADPQLLEKRRHDWGIQRLTTDYREICADPTIDGILIATPNFTHKEIAIAAARAGKHVMCEKPLGLNAGEVRQMLDAADAAGVVHMTAFTYRFAPAMRYLKQLVERGQLGRPRHFRSQRFLDLPETSWGWRQYKDKAGAGDLFDMTIHRIDFAHDLLGPIQSVSGAIARYAERTQTPDGRACPPSDVDDWSAFLGEFSNGAVGVWEGTTLAKGYHREGFGHEWAEINGSDGSAVYRLHEPNVILLGSTGHDLAPVNVPSEFLKPAGSPRIQPKGNLRRCFATTWPGSSCRQLSRTARRCPASPTACRQQVADAVLESYAQRRWIEIK